jgi:hypothetical protein
MREVVIDTVVFARAIDESARAARRGARARNFIADRARSGTLRVILDSSHGIRSEYEVTRPPEAVRALVTLLGELGALALRAPTTLKDPLRTQLRDAGFSDTVDKLVVRTAAAGEPGNRMLCSDDSDFWDPSDTGSVGDHLSCTCRILEEGGLAVLSHAELLTVC